MSPSPAPLVMVLSVSSRYQSNLATTDLRYHLLRRLGRCRMVYFRHLRRAGAYLPGIRAE